MSRNFSSPQQSPRDDIDIDGSTYALQVALRNLKERYQKLQRKVSYIEEENKRLEHGKTELFGEIGVMQESSIKLREKNLHLNQEIHNKHQENCSLRDSFNSVTQQNLTLSRDNRRLHAKVNQLLEDNTLLKQRILQTAVTSGDDGQASTRGPEMQEQSRLSPDSITPALNTSGHDTDNNSEDSIDRSHADGGSSSPADSPPRPSRPGEGEEEQRRSLNSDSDSDSVSSGGSLCAAAEETSDRMDAIMDEVQRQNQLLRDMLLACEGSDNSRRSRALPVPQPSSPGRLHAMFSVGSRGDLPPEDGRSDSPTPWQVTDDQNLVGEEAGERPTPNGEVWGSDQQPRTARGSTPAWPRYPHTTPTVPPSNPSAGMNRPPYLFLSPTDVLDEDSKICPMCNLFFAKEVSQEMFESHVVAHFEDIDVGYEVLG